MKLDDGAKGGVGSVWPKRADQFVSVPQQRSTSRNSKVLLVWICTALTSVAAAPSLILHAATLCTSVVESGWASATTEREATDRAILWWSSRAGAIGRGYESWDRAQRKNIRCEPLTDKGSVRCKVLAAPCLPDGLIPEPKTGDQAIEL